MTQKFQPLSISEVSANTEHLPDEQRDNTRWLFRYIQTNNHSLKRAAEQISQFTKFKTIDKSSLSRLFGNKLDSSNSKVYAAIAAYRKFITARSTNRAIDFVPTSLAKRILDTVDLAASNQSVVNIFGDTQIGKTAALKRASELSSIGQVIYILVPASATLFELAREVGKALGLSRRDRSLLSDLRDAIDDTLDSSYTLIFDEMHMLFKTHNKKSVRDHRLACIEFIRQLRDKSRCGLVLCGTDLWADELQSGDLRQELRQISERSVYEISLEPKPKRADLSAFFRAFELPVKPTEEAAPIVAETIKNHSLERLLNYLRLGAKLAANEGTKYTWQQFVTAYQMLTQNHN